MPGRFIRVRKMKEQVADNGDILAVAAAMRIVGASYVETLDTKGTDVANIHLGGPATITGYFGGVGQPKVPPQSNGRIDVLHVVWRNWHPTKGRTEVGHAASGVAFDSVAAPASWQPITHFEAVTESVAGSASAVFTILAHEYMHHIFGGNSFHTGSGAGYHTFMAPVGSFSMTAHAPSVS